jgi:hypothetical protein
VSLDKEIKVGALSVATDSYDMSVGELMNVYRDGELVVSPEFQRLFRWSLYQKSHFIESLLVGIPIPSIFVFELPSGKWELIDGLQRVSTILEFAGLLKDKDGNLCEPSVLGETRTLPSLNGTSWDGTPKNSKGLTTAHQISIKRARIGLQILKKTSDVKAKYDLFQRLNSHGSIATPQELRNCVLFMMNPELFGMMKKAAARPELAKVIQVTEGAQSNQALMDYVTRFMVFMFVEYDKKWDIEEFLNNGLIELAGDEDRENKFVIDAFTDTLALIVQTGEFNILKRFKDGKFTGKVGQAGFEAIFMGVAFNRVKIKALKKPSDYIVERAKALWDEPVVEEFTKGGLRGTSRIQKTIPFGSVWFEP